MSASHNMAAMFPPTNKQIWNEKLRWAAVPVHTIPEELDLVLAMKKPCPLYDEAYEKYKNSDEIQSIIKKHKKLFEYLEEKTGKKIRKICKVKSIYSTLWIEQLKNYT